jgi:hypothetical protein
VTILFYAQHALLLALLFAVAAGAGTLALGRRGGLAVRTALGLAAIGEVLFLLGLLGALRRGPILACAGLGLIAGIMRYGIRGGRWRASRPALVTAIGAALLPLFVLALYPPINFDETLYHLPFVRTFARTGGIPYLPHLRFPVFPQLHELLCVPLFLFGGDTSIHLVALLETLLTVALLWDWGRRYSAPAGPLAAALFLGSPAVIQLATIGYVDAAETLFVTATLYALDRARETGWRWAALAGVFAGAACSVKYVGGYFAVAGLVVLVFRRDRRGLAAFATGLAAAALPTYARLLYWTGNPVFPFFGHTPWVQPLETIPPAERLLRALRVAYDVTFARDRVNQQPPFTPLIMVMGLVILAAAVRGRRARAVVLLCAIYVAIFTFLPQDSRYLVPLLPLICVTAAAIVGPSLVPRRTFVVTLTLLAVCPGIAYAVYRMATRSAAITRG